MKFFLPVLSALIVMAVASVCAQSYPAKPVRLIVPYPPDGGTDIFARMPGAEAAAKAAPDGYTLVVSGDEIARETYRPQFMAPRPRTAQSRA